MTCAGAEGLYYYQSVVNTWMASNGYRTVNSSNREADDRYYFHKMKEILEAFPNKGPTYLPAKLLDYLYIGSLRNADEHSLMTRLGITHVLNMCANRRLDMHRNPYSRDTGIRQYLAITAEDQESYNIAQHFTECIAFLDDAKRSGGIAFVHCNLGVNRSGAVVAAYMLHDTDKRLLEVISYLKMKRGFVLCNKSFRKQLIQFARERGKLDPVEPYELERYKEERRRARQLCGKPPLPEDEPVKPAKDKSRKSPQIPRSSKVNNSKNKKDEPDDPDLSSFAFFRGKKNKFDSISLPEKKSKWFWKSSEKLDKNGIIPASRRRPLVMTGPGKRSVSTSDLSIAGKQEVKNVSTLDTLYEDMEDLALNGGSRFSSAIRNSSAYASMPRRPATTRRNPVGHQRQPSAPAGLESYSNPESSRPRASTYDSQTLSRKRDEARPMRSYRGSKSDTVIPPSPATAKRSFLASLFRRKPKDEEKYKRSSEY